MLENVVRMYAFKEGRLNVETTGCVLQKGGKWCMKEIITGTLIQLKEVIGFSTLKNSVVKNKHNFPKAWDNYSE